MSDVRATVTTDRKEELVSLLRRLPAILAGNAPDVDGIAAGFKARLGYAFLSLVLPNFNDLGRGMTGADGTKWPPLSKEYLAYSRRFGPNEAVNLKTAAGLGKGHRFAPGDKKGLLTLDQLKLWRRIYADRLAWYIMRLPDNEAKARAAAIAWIIVKEKGGKTKLDVFGNRQVQMLVDTGYLRGSLTPGTVLENGPEAVYSPPSANGGVEQEFNDKEQGRLIVGSNVKYAKHHHNAKSVKRQRRLWPRDFPDDWWRQILGQAIGGLTRIGELFLR